MKGATWTDTEIKKLRKMYANTDFTIDEILKEFPNRTMNAVRLKASRIGIERTYPPMDTCPHCGATLVRSDD